MPKTIKEIETQVEAKAKLEELTADAIRCDVHSRDIRDYAYGAFDENWNLSRLEGDAETTLEEMWTEFENKLGNLNHWDEKPTEKILECFRYASQNV